MIVAAAQVGERPPGRRLRGSAPALGEVAERRGPLRGLREQLGRLLAQRGDDAGLDAGRVLGRPALLLAVEDEQPHLDQQVEGVAQLAVLGDAVVGGRDLALLADLFVELGGVILEEGALIGSVARHDSHLSTAAVHATSMIPHQLRLGRGRPEHVRPWSGPAARPLTRRGARRGHRRGVDDGEPRGRRVRRRGARRRRGRGVDHGQAPAGWSVRVVRGATWPAC